MGKNIITEKEFFKLVEMFNGLPDDQAMACQVYNNSNYQEKELLDLLMCKALVFDNRKYFIDAVKMDIRIETLYSNNIVAYMAFDKANDIYHKILKEITKNK